MVPILMLTTLEGLGLGLLWRLQRRGVAWDMVLPNLLAGDFILIAWLTNATHQPWPVTAVSLLLSFLCHGVDMSRRLVKSAARANEQTVMVDRDHAIISI